MNKTTKAEWWLLAGLLALSFVPCISGGFRLLELGLDIQILPGNPRVLSAPVPAVLHILSSVHFCFLGALQLIPGIRGAYPKFHRFSGRMLIVSGLVAAMTGLWMTHFYAFDPALQGDILYFVRIVVSLAMMACIGLALSAILRMQIMHHMAWMIRAYALAQGAGTQVLLTILLLPIVGEPTGIIRDTVMTVAWLINLMVAEVVIRNQSKNLTQGALQST